MGELKCGRCDKPLVIRKTVFSYMERSFTHDVPCCPDCGKVYISMELAEGRMAEVERQLEDK